MSLKLHVSALQRTILTHDNTILTACTIKSLFVASSRRSRVLAWAVPFLSTPSMSRSFGDCFFVPEIFLTH